MRLILASLCVTAAFTISSCGKSGHKKAAPPEAIQDEKNIAHEEVLQKELRMKAHSDAVNALESALNKDGIKFAALSEDDDELQLLLPGYLTSLDVRLSQKEHLDPKKGTLSRYTANLNSFITSGEAALGEEALSAEETATLKRKVELAKVANSFIEKRKELEAFFDAKTELSKTGVTPSIVMMRVPGSEVEKRTPNVFLTVAPSWNQANVLTAVTTLDAEAVEENENASSVNLRRMKRAALKLAKVSTKLSKDPILNDPRIFRNESIATYLNEYAQVGQALASFEGVVNAERETVEGELAIAPRTAQGIGPTFHPESLKQILERHLPFQEIKSTKFPGSETVVDF